MRAILLRIQIMASQGFLVGDAQASQVDAALAPLELDKRMGLDKTVDAAKFTARLAPQCSNNLFQHLRVTAAK